MANELFGRYADVYISGAVYAAHFNMANLHIEFEVEFDDDSKPNISSVSIYNLSQTSRSRIVKGANIAITAGYRKDGTGVILQGKITNVTNNKDAVDRITKISVKEGQDYSHIKIDTSTADAAVKYQVKKRVKLKKPIVTYTKTKTGKKKKKTISYRTVSETKYKKRAMKKSFGKNTRSSTIIRWCARTLGMKITTLSLPTDKIYKKGYTITGSIEAKMEEVVKNCGAVMYYRRGNMVIRSIKVGNDERFTLSAATGLLDSPEQSEDDDGKKIYTVRSLLQYRIATASIISISSKTVNGTFRVKSGKHICNGSDFITELVVF